MPMPDEGVCVEVHTRLGDGEDDTVRFEGTIMTGGWWARLYRHQRVTLTVDQTTAQQIMDAQARGEVVFAFASQYEVRRVAQ